MGSGKPRRRPIVATGSSVWAIVIDAQLNPVYADEAAAYARGLGKPLDRLIVTHAHPDHHNGAASFDAPVHVIANRSLFPATAPAGAAPDAAGRPAAP
ncbi:glyoxylase-like metal-dependent hydrolase (beta-lactamase superfamily II) [Streptomyces achromogenes]|uniref:Glyoxylase-like metal-dependent hydrolase (Beta-lactamase superfamily II) n=1 Tax=Streptomyces achromogenes TaxID=67255 RepID=A0ABU0QCI5_STRAH|nr:glyoxylase-like metal-dependent hydrolase (beta-lactamase superfamily II) [Streptomyces achromogenes]MDQ0835568.1 glyoxylase-like metal-dependent hydrolase (beta-lactamase superfamily II) [Streptomyces achromogenes]